AGRDQAPATGETLAFIALAACWAEGHGMHLAANSIGHLLGDLPASDAAGLTHFYDEVLGHFIWHFGILGLSALLIYRHWRYPPAGSPAGWLAPGLAGLIHGLTYFIIVVEAGTGFAGVPFAAAVAVIGLGWGRRQWRQQPVLAFFTVAYSIATVLFIGWALYW